MDFASLAQYMFLLLAPCCQSVSPLAKMGHLLTWTSRCLPNTRFYTNSVQRTTSSTSRTTTTTKVPQQTPRKKQVPQIADASPARQPASSGPVNGPACQSARWPRSSPAGPPNNFWASQRAASWPAGRSAGQAGSQAAASQRPASPDPGKSQTFVLHRHTPF